MAIPLNTYRVAEKRVLDVAVASALLILSAPVLAIAAVAIRLSSSGPVVFSQERYGLHRQRFRIYKLRTMVVDAEARQAALEAANELQGPAFKIRKDPRLTSVGTILRKTSIDELPQLWNVILGNMSLVGPRPLPLRDVDRAEEAWPLKRFSVKPGITCLWQVSGRSHTSFADWIRQDLQYIDDRSLLLDVQILIRTVPAVIFGRGAM